MGAFAGDGSCTYSLNNKNNPKEGGQYRIRYHLSLRDDYLYGLYLKSLLNKMNLNTHVFIRENNGTFDVAVSSKDFSEFIKRYLIWEGKKTYSIRLKYNLSRYSSEFLKGFVRGLMDTDGYVEISNPGITVTSKKLINNLMSILNKFNIKYKFSIRKHNDNRKDGQLVRIYSDSLDRYNSCFGFSNNYKQRKLNKILSNRKRLKSQLLSL